MTVGLRNSTGLDGKLILCSREISNKKKKGNFQCHWIIKKGEESTKGTGLEKSYQAKDGADEE